MMTGRVKLRSFVSAALGASLLAVLPARAVAESAAAFFQGKQMRFYTMGSPGFTLLGRPTITATISAAAVSTSVLT